MYDTWFWHTKLYLQKQIWTAMIHLCAPGSPLDASQHGAMDHGTPDGDRPTMRNLESQTTIPLGHVNDEDVDGILAIKYDQPLWRCLFENNPEKEVEVDSLVPPTGHWLETRWKKGDVETLDPPMTEACHTALKLKEILDEKERLSKVQEKKRAVELSKIDNACDAMVSQQFAKVKSMDVADPEKSPLFKVNKKNILVWKANKYQIVEKAFQCETHLHSMIEHAFSIWEETNLREPEVGVDPDLFGELAAIMQESEPHGNVSWPKFQQVQLESRRVWYVTWPSHGMLSLVKPHPRLPSMMMAWAIACLSTWRLWPTKGLRLDTHPMFFSTKITLVKLKEYIDL